LLESRRQKMRRNSLNSFQLRKVNSPHSLTKSVKEKAKFLKANRDQMFRRLSKNLRDSLSLILNSSYPDKFQSLMSKKSSSIHQRLQLRKKLYPLMRIIKSLSFLRIWREHLRNLVSLKNRQIKSLPKSAPQ
jgi:hypothetical protein